MDVVEFVKKNRLIYGLYYYTANIAIKLLKIFVGTDDKLILFVSYGGRHFNDSPKCIYEAMLADSRFADYRLVWAFRNPSNKDVPNKIKIDTLKYYITALSARCWVTNVTIERGLNFTGKHTYYFHTTHGTLPKYSGSDVTNKEIFGHAFHHNYDCSCAQSEEDKRLQISMFNLKPEQIIVCGYPKNDPLAAATGSDRDRILGKMGIDKKKKTILYAPTFRDNSEDNMIPMDFDKWQRRLGNEYVLLFRAHPVIADKMNLPKNGIVKDVSSYADNMDIMIASDILISDYSGIFFEYAILDRPMFCYAYDYDEYIKKRGLYMDLRKELPSGTEDEIIDMILAQDKSKYLEKVKSFKDKYVSEYGHATEKAVENIYQHIAE